MENVPRTTNSVQNTAPAPGMVVEVVLCGGEVANRVVWEVVDELVFVCNAKTYERLSQGQEAAMPIGFPASDVKLIS